MERLHHWDVASVDTLATVKHLVKYTTSDDSVARETTQKSSDSALNIIEAIPVFTDLGESDLKLAMELTKKPYVVKRWN